MMRRLLMSCALLLIACEKSPPRDPEPSNAALMRAADKPAHAGDPHAAATPHGGAAAPASHHSPSEAAGAGANAPSGPAKAGGLTWEAPAPFVRRAPKSSMRVAEYGLASEPQAELGVFYFGPDQGGSVEANMTRWVGQFTQADGSETKPIRTERKVQGVEVSLIEARGVYSGGMAMPGAPAAAAVPDALLLGAIAKGPLGAVFFKFVGPRAALEGARGAFDGLIASLRNSEQPRP
jgi:hypothetical protein